MTTRIYLDTNVFISAFEAVDERSDQLWILIAAFGSGEFSGVTSELTLAELLPKPSRSGQHDLVLAYSNFVEDGPLLTVPKVSRGILTVAANLRAAHPSLKLPDAIHLATAIEEECSILLSDDRRLPLPGGMRAVRLGPNVLQDLGKVIS